MVGAPLQSYIFGKYLVHNLFGRHKSEAFTLNEDIVFVIAVFISGIATRTCEDTYCYQRHGLFHEDR